MTNKDFIKELKQEIEKHERKIEDAGNRSKYFGVNRRVDVPDDYLSDKNIINIKGLYSFAKKHKELSGGQIEDMIRQNKSTFKFLNKFINCIEGMVDVMRIHGHIEGAMVYRKSLACIDEMNKSLKQGN